MTLDAAPLVSVIIPTYNDADALIHCLHALARQKTSTSFEVVVVSSGRSDSIPETLPNLDLRIVRHEHRLLAGSARNLGAEYSSGAILAFTDADCQPDVDWIDAIVSSFRSRDGMVGGSIGHVHPLLPIPVADNILQFSDYLPGRPAGPSDHLAGCNMAVRRDVFAAVDGFPPDLKTGEDILLAERIASMRSDAVQFVPGMRVRHTGRSSVAAMWAHQRRFGYDRARLSLRLKRGLRRRLRSRLFAAAFCLRRFLYLLYRTTVWYPFGLPRFVLFSPWILIGLAAYARGLRAGALTDGYDA